MAFGFWIPSLIPHEVDDFCCSHELNFQWCFSIPLQYVILPIVFVTSCPFSHGYCALISVRTLKVMLLSSSQACYFPNVFVR